MKIPQSLARWANPNYRAAVARDFDRILQHVEEQGPFGWWAEVHGAAYFNELEGLRWPFARALWGSTKWIFQALHCAFTDHEFEDDSYGGPESGCMAGHCARCGYSFHTTLY